VIWFFAFQEAFPLIIYTTSAIEALNAKLRSALRSRGHFSPMTSRQSSCFSLCAIAFFTSMLIERGAYTTLVFRTIDLSIFSTNLHAVANSFVFTVSFV
jgi:hypothetical protein